MNEPSEQEREKQRIVKRAADAVIKEWALKGKVIEGGWRAMVLMTGLDTASEVQRQEMRKAYYFGAQHLFAALVNAMDDGAEPTDQDEQIMENVSAELQKFIEECTAQPKN